MSAALLSTRSVNVVAMAKKTAKAPVKKVRECRPSRLAPRLMALDASPFTIQTAPKNVSKGTQWYGPDRAKWLGECLV